MVKKVGIFVKPREIERAHLEHLMETVKNAGHEALLEDRAAEILQRKGYPRKELGALCDIAIVLGGDGSMLGVARAIAEFNRPIIGVNAGRLGFITDVVLDDMDKTLPLMLNGECTSDCRYLLEGTVLRDGKEVFSALAGNDIGFSHGRAGGMVDFIVYVNGQQMSSQSADGIICSTAMGSTAYALAAGGPILYPSLDAMLLVPVAPHTVSNRPIVLPGDVSVEIQLVKARDAVAYFDMQEFCDVQPGDVLSIRRSNYKIEMLHPLDYDYFELLRRKLNWNFSPKSVHLAK